MKKLVSLILCLVALSITNINAQKKPVHKATATPFQGVKEFCSFTRHAKFKVSITGNKIVITKTYNENSSTVTGMITNGKIYTNDPLEKSYNFGGKYYLLSKTEF